MDKTPQLITCGGCSTFPTRCVVLPCEASRTAGTTRRRPFRVANSSVQAGATVGRLGVLRADTLVMDGVLCQNSALLK